MNWLYYLAEANIYLTVFYLAYCAFLNTQTYYQLNRAYLISSCVVAFILPVLQIGALKPAQVVVAPLQGLEYQLSVDYTPHLPTADIVQVGAAPMLSINHYLWFGYLTGSLVLLVALLVKLYSLYKLLNKAERTQQAGYKLVQLPQSDSAFSFFNYLFIGNNTQGNKTIIRHELVHIRQKHSVDIVFLEILKIINWFNPFIYLLQNSLKTVHEYIADEQTAAHETDPISYSTFLLNNAYGTGGSSVTHSFFNYNLLKRRIIMLNQKRSGNLARLRYLVALPVVAASLCASTLAFSKTYGWIDIAPAKTIEQQDIPTLPKLAHVDKNEGIVLNISKNNTVIGFNEPKEKQAPPLIVANGKRYRLAQLQKNYSVIISADSTTQYHPGNAYAAETWGEDAKNGVLVLHGKSAEVKIEKGYLPETAHINFIQPQQSGKLPPPSVFKKGFGRLMGHLQQKITWTDELKNEKNSYVGVSFNVGADKKISDIQIFKSAGNGFDAVAKAAFESFDGVVTATPGKHTFMLNYYSEKGPNQPGVLDGSKYDVNLVIVRPKPGEIKVKFPPPVVEKTKRSAVHTLDKNGGYVAKGRLNNSQIALTTMISADPKFTIIVNGKQYKFDKECVAKYKSKALIAISCDKTTVYNNGNKYAKAKWGNDVGKVIVLEGNASLQFVDYNTAKQSDNDDLILASAS